METKKKGGLYNFFYDFSKHDETSLKEPKFATHLTFLSWQTILYSFWKD
jgi:hypothetical protein